MSGLSIIHAEGGIASGSSRRSSGRFRVAEARSSAVDVLRTVASGRSERPAAPRPARDWEVGLSRSLTRTGPDGQSRARADLPRVRPQPRGAGAAARRPEEPPHGLPGRDPTPSQPSAHRPVKQGPLCRAPVGSGQNSSGMQRGTAFGTGVYSKGLLTAFNDPCRPLGRGARWHRGRLPSRMRG